MAVILSFRRHLKRTRLFSLLRRALAGDAAHSGEPERTRQTDAKVADISDRRRLTRIRLGLNTRIRRGDGTVIDVRCEDANDQAFAICTDAPFAMGEFVTLTLGSRRPGPSFLAQVIWCERGRVGFQCIASADLPAASNM